MHDPTAPISGASVTTSQRLALVTRLVYEILAPSQPVKLERVAEGVSTEVYRVWHDGDVLYLRILPEKDASFGPEALVHQLLREHGVHVPDIVYVEQRHPVVQRSVMVTTAIRGEAVVYHAAFDRLRDVIVQAGQELAVINRIPVAGFGWIRRDEGQATHLEAEFPMQRIWLNHELDGVLARLHNAAILNTDEINAIERLLVQYAALFDDTQAYLAHGDFDVTHIYHQHGHYSGIIDFGEIRGAHQLYDIGHFAIEHHELLPWLLEGYRDVTSLPVDHIERIELTSLWIALRRLGRAAQKQTGSVYLPDLHAVRRAVKTL